MDLVSECVCVCVCVCKSIGASHAGELCYTDFGEAWVLLIGQPLTHNMVPGWSPNCSGPTAFYGSMWCQDSE